MTGWELSVKLYYRERWAQNIKDPGWTVKKYLFSFLLPPMLPKTKKVIVIMMSYKFICSLFFFLYSCCQTYCMLMHVCIYSGIFYVIAVLRLRRNWKLVAHLGNKVSMMDWSFSKSLDGCGGNNKCLVFATTVKIVWQFSVGPLLFPRSSGM